MGLCAYMGEEDHSQVSQYKKYNWTWDYVHIGEEDHPGTKRTIEHGISYVHLGEEDHS